MEEIRKIQTANPSEWEKVTAFLRERDLPVRREYADACFGAFIGGRLVGTVILSGRVVRNTAVDPEMRHKGIVEKLFTAVIEEARERGIDMQTQSIQQLDLLSAETNRSRNELINLLLEAAIPIVKVED